MGKNIKIKIILWDYKIIIRITKANGDGDGVQT